jgi:hypothetical protein
VPQAGQPPAEQATESDEDAPPALRTTTRSGFLKDYSRLQPIPTHKHVLAERSPKLVTYKTFLVQTPQVIPTATITGKPIDAATADQLAAELKAAVTQALGINFKITDRPGEGVAVVRAAITQVGECFHQPGNINRQIGGASVEMEIVDAVTGERLAAAVESDAVTTNDPSLKSNDPYYDVRLVFQHWSSRLAKWLADAEQ